MPGRSASAAAAFSVVVVFGTLFVSPAQASAESDGLVPPSLTRVMDDYPADDFVIEAATLPVELVDAIERDLELTAEEYLAQGVAALDAGVALDSLESAGVTVLGSALEGTELVVHVRTADDAAAVAVTGATPVLGEPVPNDFSDENFELMADMRGGEAYYFEVDGQGGRCSVGFNGFNGSGQRQFATAGHCSGTPLTNAGMYSMLDTTAANNFSGGADDVGAPVSGAFRFGDGYDTGIVAVTEPGWTPRAEVVTWGFGAGAPLASAPIHVRDMAPAIIGASLCKSGSTTGWTCGTILEVDTNISAGGEAINAIISTACMLPGDSGGAALMSATAVGINSASSWVGNCDRNAQPNAVSAFFPMTSSDTRVATVKKAYGTSWEPAVSVNAPVVTTPSSGSAYTGNVLSGTLAQGNVRHRVEVYLDGSTTPLTAAVTSSGTWSVNLGTLSGAFHSYQVKARWGVRSVSAATSGSWFATSVDRLPGATRYDVAVAVSKRAFPSTASTVYVVTGENYPDALSAASAAVADNGPILLTKTASLPASVKTEITRLSPQRIVVVGGAGAVSTAVLQELGAIAPTRRIGGEDRYAVSRAVAEYAFGFGFAATAYIATGADFPDALSASAAGAAAGSPVILVRGSDNALDPATRELLQQLGVTRIKIAGGDGVVSNGIEADLSRMALVSRLGGADRFATSRLINNDAYTASDHVYLATGFNYPDALAGAALAGRETVPMFAVRTSCVPQGVLDDIEELGARSVTLLGGAGVLTAEVAALKSCLT